MVASKFQTPPPATCMSGAPTPTGISKSVLFISVSCFFHFIHFIHFFFQRSREGVEHRPRSQIDTRYAGVNDGYPSPGGWVLGSMTPRDPSPMTRLRACLQSHKRGGKRTQPTRCKFDLFLTCFREAEKGWNIAREAGMTPVMLGNKHRHQVCFNN